MAVGTTTRSGGLPGGGPGPQRGGPQVLGHGGQGVLGDGVDDGDDGEAHDEADDQRVALHVGVDQAAARIQAQAEARTRPPARPASRHRGRQASRTWPGRKSPQRPHDQSRETCRSQGFTTEPVAPDHHHRRQGKNRIRIQPPVASPICPSSQRMMSPAKHSAPPPGPAGARSAIPSGNAKEHGREPPPLGPQGQARGRSCQACAPRRKDSGKATPSRRKRPGCRPPPAQTPGRPGNPSTTLGRLAISSTAGLIRSRRPGLQELAGEDGGQQGDGHTEEQREDGGLQRCRRSAA